MSFALSECQRATSTLKNLEIMKIYQTFLCPHVQQMFYVT